MTTESVRRDVEVEREAKRGDEFEGRGDCVNLQLVFEDFQI